MSGSATLMENGGGEMENGPYSHFSRERRPSIIKLQGMLKRVSQSPFQNQSKDRDGDLSASRPDDPQPCLRWGGVKAEDGPALHAGVQNGVSDRGAWNPFHCSPQNGVGAGLSRVNPFYQHYIESRSETTNTVNIKRDAPEDAGLDTIFAPPPEFESSTLDLMSGIQTKSPDPQTDLFQSHTPDLLRTSALPEKAPGNGKGFHKSPLTSLDILGSTPLRKQDVSQPPCSNGACHVRAAERDDLVQGGQKENLFQAMTTKEPGVFNAYLDNFLDHFQSPSNKGEDVCQPTPSKEFDLFQAPPLTDGKSSFDSTTNAKALEDIFTSPFTEDPFPSPKPKNPFQLISNTSDPFPSTPSQPDFSNGTTPDIFQPQNPGSSQLTTNGRDIFRPEKPEASKFTFSPMPLHNSSEASNVFTPSWVDTPASTPQTPSSAHLDIHPSSSDRPSDIDVVLTTPHGTKHDILLPTPFSQARNLSPSEMTHVKTFSRPPKPLPRTRPPKPKKPSEPEVTSPLTSPKTPPKPPPKPAVRIAPKLPARPVPQATTMPQSPLESQPVKPESFAVFEDILLIGEERCVEDWPENSPQLRPEFKPSGRLRLRRESLKTKGDSDGGSGEDQDGSGKQNKNKIKKFRVSLLSRRGSKEKFTDDGDGNTGTLPRMSKAGFPGTHLLDVGEHEEQSGADCKSRKPLKEKVHQLLRRTSTSSPVQDKKAYDSKYMNGHLPEESKDEETTDGLGTRRWSMSEEMKLDRSSEGGEDDEDGNEEASNNGFKRRRTVRTVKSVPRRGFAISLDKNQEDRGNSPRRDSNKENHKLYGAHGQTHRKESQDENVNDIDGAMGFTSPSTSKAATLEDEHSHKGWDLASDGVTGDEYLTGMEDCKPKKPTRGKLLSLGRRKSKDDMFDEKSPRKSSASTGEMDDEEQNGMDYCKPKKHVKHKGAIHRKSKKSQETILHDGCHISLSHESEGVFLEDDTRQKGGDLYTIGQLDEDDEEDCKPQKKKPLKLKGLKKHKAKSKAMGLEHEDPPGATSSDYYYSEAAQAEWLASQKDERLESGVEEGEEEGDTDSLMEWWNTVEQWDEVTSDDDCACKIMEEDESKSFQELAEKVHRGLQVFNKVFTERAEVLWHYIISLHAIADDISTFHRKAKVANITGGTTTAVGGVTAIAGLALAPLTMGVSLIVTAIGVGVATAGGIASASATISDNVNNMHDRKKVEVVLQDYENHLLDLVKILHFVNEGLYRLRGHAFLRGGNQHFSEDWEVRRSVQMTSLVDGPVRRASEITDDALASVMGLFKGMDQYFIKDSRELKKGCKKEVVGQIKDVANILNNGLVELNAIREELQDAIGNY